MTASTESRPATATSEEIRKALTGKTEEAWTKKGELWRFKILDRIIDELSGMGGNTTEDFQKYYAMVYSQSMAGLDCDEELIALREYARISGDIQGKNKVQIVQMLEEKAAVFPGAGGLYPPEEPKMGFIEWIKFKLSGEKPQ